MSSITKRAASPEVLAAASEKAQEIRKTHAALPPAERQRRKAMGAAAAGGALLAPIGGAVGGALGAEKGNRGRTALRAGLGALGGGVVGALTGRRLGVYMGQGLGAAVGANSAHKAHQRVKERAIREYEASKTAALLEGIIEGLEKHAGVIGDLINETGKITARTQRIRQGARDKYHKAAINAEEAAHTRVRRQNVARDLKHLRATTGPGYRESIKHPSRMFRALERDNARRALRKAIRGLRA